jgi:hypothetical protein
MPDIAGEAIGYIQENLSNLNPGAGTITLQGLVVPAGQVWSPTHSAARNNSAIATFIQVRVLRANGGIQTISYDLNPAAGRWMETGASIELLAGDRIEALFGGTVAGNDLYFDYTGTQYRRVA